MVTIMKSFTPKHMEGIVEIEKSEYRMILPYNAYTLIKRLLESVEATIDEEKFDTMIEISGKLPSSNTSKMKEGTDDIGQGRIALDINT